MKLHLLRPTAAFLLALVISALPCPASAGQDESAFAATGLLTRPDESAEEILVRAHKQDTRAMLLVLTGYRQGIGGFPQRREAGTMWAGAITRFRLPFTYAFMALLAVDKGRLDENDTAGYLAACTYALRSRYASRFKEAGIFDAEQACADLAGRVQRSPAWQAEYDKGLSQLRDMQAEAQKTIALARKLVDVPMTKEDEAAYAQGDFGDPDVFVFYAATTHDPETEAPDWSGERLLRLIGNQRGGGEAQAELRFAAQSAMMSRLGADVEQNLALIRRAHAGDPEAERIMGLNYLNGSQGFPSDPDLQNAWILYSALHGDARSMELRAVDLFAGGHPEAAWLWARLTREFGDDDAKRRAGLIVTELEKAFSSPELAAREKRLVEIRRQILSPPKPSGEVEPNTPIR